MEKRPALILKLLTEEYIKTATPVASQALVEKYGLDFSPATVRNDLADLEKRGYIKQPHTSAGRIPTELAYRYFIKQLKNEAPDHQTQIILKPYFNDLDNNWQAFKKIGQTVLADYNSNPDNKEAMLKIFLKKAFS